MEKIIGRENEIALLNHLESSCKAEFIAIYGRRRVGKTFLIDQLYRDRLAFRMVGVIDGSLEDQMIAFKDAMEDFGYQLDNEPKDWMHAFISLKKALLKRVGNDGRCIIFIDELPALDAENSNVAQAIGYFWNNWAKLHDNITLIVCGSATSWMIKNVIDDHGGLHDRITQEMHIHPFRLKEVENYLITNDFHWNRLMILQTYMVFGGVPYYLSLLHSNESLVQNIDRLFFGTNGEMRREYERLLSTLYKSPKIYMNIIRVLCDSKKGLTRQEIADKLKINNNGHLGDKLDELVCCDIVRKLPVREKKIKRNESIFQLRDLFCIFYLTFINKTDVELNYWSHHINTPEINTWLGLSFERVAMEHVEQIKQGLGISGISTLTYSWRSKDSTPGAQIDLVIERADMIVNLCEAKYSMSAFEIDKDEYEKLLNRAQTFTKETGMRHAVWVTMLCTFGLKSNSYSSVAQNVITMDDLFA